MENNTDTTQQSASSVQPVQEQNSGADVHGHTNGQSKKIGHYIGAAFGIIFILVFFLPNSVYAQMLAFPIMALGAVTGIKFFVDSIVASKRSNPLIRTFVIFGSLGVGVVIFFVFMFVGMGVMLSKDPQPEHS
jgi:hypothetical protein